MGNISQYLASKQESKNIDYTSTKVSIDSNLTTTVFSLIKTYLNQLDIVSAPMSLNSRLSKFEYSIGAAAQLQSIYGFKAFQTPSVRSEMRNELSQYTNLENAYESVIKTGDKTPITKICHFTDFVNYNTYIYLLYHDKIDFTSTIHGCTRIKATDIVAMLNTLMGILTNIRKLHYNIYIKTTKFGGSLQMQVCSSCDLRDVDKDDHSQWYHAILVGPYSKKNDVIPTIHDNAGNSRSIQVRTSDQNTLNNNNNDVTGLIYAKTFESDTPTFDITSEEGSNGIFTFFRQISYDTFDLASKINVSKMFGIEAGRIITAERVNAAINYIFETWQKNIKIMQCNYFVCHNNCHSNSINSIAEVPKFPVSGSITYDYSALDSSGIEYTQNGNNPDTVSTVEGSSATVKIYYPNGQKADGWKFKMTINGSKYVQKAFKNNEYISITVSYTDVQKGITVKYEVEGGSEYSIAYTKDGKSTTGIKPTKYSSKITDQTITTNTTPTITGKSFSHWQIVGSDTPGTGNSFVIPANTTGKITVDGVFSDNLYTITYKNIPAGGRANNETTAEYNETIILNDPELPDGYTFVKWSKSSSGAKISSIKITSDTKIYCIYKESQPSET